MHGACGILSVKADLIDRLDPVVANIRQIKRIHKKLPGILKDQGIRVQDNFQEIQLPPDLDLFLGHCLNAQRNGLGLRLLWNHIIKFQNPFLLRHSGFPKIFDIRNLFIFALCLHGKTVLCFHRSSPRQKMVDPFLSKCD